MINWILALAAILAVLPAAAYAQELAPIHDDRQYAQCLAWWIATDSKVANQVTTKVIGDPRALAACDVFQESSSVWRMLPSQTHVETEHKVCHVILDDSNSINIFAQFDVDSWQFGSANCVALYASGYAVEWTPRY